MAQVHSLQLTQLIRNKLSDYALLFKVKLSSLVVFSALAGYAWAFEQNGHLITSLLWLAIGGFLVTGASNAINQIIEKDIDKLMERTKNRPLPTERMTIIEAALVAGIAAVAGILILTFLFNSLSGLLAAISLISYAFIYTPLKRITPLAVAVGAIPGALPPIIGYVAATNTLSPFAALLFLIQFIWQFPHFWSIAWLKYDDYKSAGIMLLPSQDGKSRQSAVINLVYLVALIFAGILPFVFGFLTLLSTIILTIAGLIFLIPAAKLFYSLNQKDAKQLLFGSLIYLPVSLLIVLFDKWM